MVKIRENGYAAKRMIDFVLHAEPGKEVSIAGSFNDWEPGKALMAYDQTAKAYTLTIDLDPGYYEYKFVVNGVWILDETNPNFAANDFGTLNSVLNIE